MSSLRNWILAFRPKTLSAAIAPVTIGTSMAYAEGSMHLVSAISCLLSAVSIQVGTNLANDYFDFIKGTDNESRIGPTRVTQAGLIKPGTVRIAFILSFLLSFILGLYLIYRGGWPILIIGILSIISGILYTAGPKPLGYVGLGDIFVLIFFGPVAVGGTYYVQALDINWTVIISGLAPGLISVAILTVNNLRDIDSDRATGKRTLAVRFGRGFTRVEFLLSLLLASLVPLFLYFIEKEHPMSLIACSLIFIAIPAIRTVFRKEDGPNLNSTLAVSGQLLLIYSLIFSIGWII